MRLKRRRLKTPFQIQNESLIPENSSFFSKDFQLQVLKELSVLKRYNHQLQEQISMIHGAFEELCERQESSHAVQLEFATRMTSLHESQVESMGQLVKLVHGKFYESQLFSPKKSLENISSQNFDSTIEVSLSAEKNLLRKRAFRLRASARHTRKLRVGSLDGEVVFDDAILVLPENSDVH